MYVKREQLNEEKKSPMNAKLSNHEYEKYKIEHVMNMHYIIVFQLFNKSLFEQQLNNDNICDCENVVVWHIAYTNATNNIF